MPVEDFEAPIIEDAHAKVQVAAKFGRFGPARRQKNIVLCDDPTRLESITPDPTWRSPGAAP
ncbi:MAG: hypothetical protein ACLPKT_24020 [Methylocella sp.]